MKKTVLLILVMIIQQPVIHAQLTGEVNYDQIGISFTIPDGWFGQEGEDQIMLMSYNTPGIIIITTHTYSLQELRSQAKMGIEEGYGTSLALAGELDELSENAIGGLFVGTLEGQSAKAYTIGTVNPYEGPGLSIIAATTADLYSESYKELAEKLYRSLSFSKVEKESEVDEWIGFLSDVRLTYMDSYSSSGSGGYSTETRIDLCSEGYFNYNNNDEMTVGGYGTSGYSTTNQRGVGKWEVLSGTGGAPVLVLNFYDNETHSYELSYEDNKTYLNGYRYFRTMDGEYAPDCE